jgi:uncharacterized protein YndB with AHSA1/START domain
VIKTFHRDRREVRVAAPPAAVHRTVCALGGANGWLAWDRLWRLRGWFDRAVGGPGMRGRPHDRGHSGPVYVGDVIDVWRVEAVHPPHRLLLRAEMRVPGEAWLEFRAEPDGPGTRLIQEARFAPAGLFGHLYWYAMVPAHLVLFPAMARAIAQRAAAGTDMKADAPGAR